MDLQCKWYSIWISDKTDFKPKWFRRDREGYYKLKGKTNKSTKRPLQFLASVYQTKNTQVFKGSTKIAYITYWSSHTEGGDFNTRLQPTDRPSWPKLNTDVRRVGPNRGYKLDGPNIFTEHFTHTRKNIPSSVHLTELSPKLTIYSDIKQVSADTRELK